MIALNIAPGIYRSSFAFEHWRDFDKEMFDTLYNDDSDERPFTHHIYGADASFYCVRATEKNIKRAGMSKYISVRQCRIQDLQPEMQSGFVIMNPPYGERLTTKQNTDIMTLYSEIGKALKFRFSGSTAWLISSNEEALKNVGLRSSRKIHLLNGELECLFCKYELFAGTQREYKAEKGSGFRKEKERSDSKAFKGSKPFRGSREKR